MSSTSSAASAGSASASSAPECEPSRSAKSIPIAKPCCESTGQMSLFSETCENSAPKFFPTPDTGMSLTGHGRRGGKTKNGRKSGANLDAMAKHGELISFAAASPVRTSQSLEKAQALKALARDCGANTPELLAKYDPATSSWRTSQLCLDGELSVFSETWPRSGLMRNGTAYQLPPLVPLTDEIGSGLLPTPGTQEGGPMPPDTNYQPNQRSYNTRTGKHVQITIRRYVEEWPTPTSDRYSGLQSHGRNAILGSLNPTWVEWLMGFPLEWTALEPSATQSFRRSRKS
jgi:hypothetical protein